MVSPPTQTPTVHIPWSPTAQAFAQHQFSHLVNFWKQGRQASYRLEALPGGQAVLNLTFQLPTASEVIPPPSHVPAPQRPIQPLFPRGYFPQRSGVDSRTKASQKKDSSKQRKSFRRSVLHRAALAAHSLPPPKNGSLRQAAQACVQRLQAVSATPVSPQSAKKRPLPDSPSAISPSNLLPLAQRIRTDIQVGESEVDSPEKETLRSPPCPESSPSPISPCVKGFPSPAPLVFTPVQPERSKCVNCDAEMTPDHQCKCEELVSSTALAAAEQVEFEKAESVENVEVDKVFETAKETVEEKEVQDTLSEEKRAEMKVRIRLLEEALRLHKLEMEKDKTPKCLNCGEVFAADHQCMQC